MNVNELVGMKTMIEVFFQLFYIIHTRGVV